MALSPIEQRVKFVFEEKGLDELQAKVNKVNSTLEKHSAVINKLMQVGTKLQVSQNKTAKAVHKLRREFIAKGEDLLKVTGVAGNYKRALQGNEMALNKVKEAVRKYRVQQKKTNGIVLKAQKGIFGLTRNTRLLNMSMAVLRSKLLIAAFAFRMLQQTVGQVMKAYAKQVDAEKKLQNVLKTTGNAAGISARGLAMYAQALSQSSRSGDEVIINAMAMMATFKNISGQTFKDAVAISLDLSEVMGQDLKSSIVQVGKALDDPKKGLTALSRVGVSFSEEQKKLIKNFSDTNQKAKAQAIIMKALDDQFKGARGNISNVSMTFAQLGQAWGDFTEQVGKTLAPIVTPALQSLTVFLRRFDTDFNRTYASLIAAGADEAQINKILESIAKRRLIQLKSEHEALFKMLGLKDLNLQTDLDASIALDALGRGREKITKLTSESNANFIKGTEILSQYGLASDGARASIKAYLESLGGMSGFTKAQLKAFKENMDNAFDLREGEEWSSTFMQFFDRFSSAGSASLNLVGAAAGTTFDAFKMFAGIGGDLININEDYVNSFEDLTDAQKMEVVVGLQYIEGAKLQKEELEKLAAQFGITEEAILNYIETQGKFQKSTAKARTTFEKWVDNNVKGIGKVVSAYDGLLSAYEANATAFDEANRKEELSTAKTQSAKDKINETYDKKAEARASKLRDWKIASAISNTGVAIMQTLADPSMSTWMKWTAAALMAGTAATQVATIKGEKFEQGGLVGGRRHSAGGTMIEAERGEFVMSRKAVEAVGIEGMNRINQGGGQPVNVNITGNILSQDFIEDEAIPMIKDAIRRGADIGVS